MTLSPARPNSLPATAVFADTATIAARHLIRLSRTPQLLAAALTSPVLFMVLLRYVFGGAIPLPGMTYVDYLIPAMLIQDVVFSGLSSAAALATDAREGTVDRFKSLPMAHTAVLTGRAAADVLVEFTAICLTLAAGLLVGFRFHTTPTNAVVAVALTLLFGLALFWVFAWMAFTTRNPETTQALTPVFFLLLFVSSSFIPVNTLPGWLQAFARNQPISQWANAVRCLTQSRPAELLLGHTTSYYLTTSLLWCAGIILVFGVLAMRAFRRP